MRRHYFGGEKRGGSTVRRYTNPAGLDGHLGALDGPGPCMH